MPFYKKPPIMTKILLLLKEMSRFKFVLSILTISLIVGFLRAVVQMVGGDILAPWKETPLEVEKNLFQSIVIAVIVAPLLETGIFQVLIYRLLRRIRFFKEKTMFIILVSALFFGLVHAYSLSNNLAAFSIGLVYMTAYVARIKKDRFTFFLIVFAHALHNGIILGLFNCAELM